MRVFCLTHQKSFPAPRKNPIKCENRDHVLGELDFAGRAVEPASARWAYCNDCEHFWAINPDEKITEKCPVCARSIVARYLCHRCYTFSLESNTPADVKNFTMSKQGVPQPGCPACLKELPDKLPLQEHSCEVLGASFKTLLNACPICEELIGAAPSFPSSAQEYLNKVKAKKKVRFNYESDLLVLDDAGEFVLIPNGKEHSIVLPQRIRFTGKQDFYDYYENHFHCEHPAAGEVIILYPAIVNKVDGGWKLKEAGRLKVTAAPAETARERAAAILPTTTQNVRMNVKESVKPEAAAAVASTICPRCVSTVKATDTFCWKCGENLRDEIARQNAPKAVAARPTAASKPAALPQTASLPKTTSAPKPVVAPKPAVATKPEASKPDASKPTAPVPPNKDEKRTPTLQQKPAPPLMRSTILDTEMPEPEGDSQSRKLGGILLMSLIGLIAIGAIIWLVLSLTSSAPENRNKGNVAASQKQANTQNAEQPGAATTQNPEEALKSLQEKARSAGPDNQAQAKVLEDYEAAEKKYSQDYRFPYERARLLAQTRSHNEALRALYIAGERALDNGKSVEMLNSLRRDEDGDFKSISKGHKEWNTLVKALKNNDKKMLKIVIPF